jgi:hypothetical protein
MDEKSDQILNHIESQRSQLGRNLDELEHKVKRTADWRNHFEDNPALMLGLALGGGLIVGSMVGGSSSKRRYRYRGGSTGSNWSGARSRSNYGTNYESDSSSYDSTSSLSGASTLAGTSASTASSFEEEHDDNSATTHQRRRAVEALDHIKAALIAFGIAKSKEFLAQALPGFQEHLDRTSSSSPSSSNMDEEDRGGMRNRTDRMDSESQQQYSHGRETVGVGSESAYARTSTELGD